MAKHTKSRRSAEKSRRGKGSRKYGGRVKDDTTGVVLSGARGTIAKKLIDTGLKNTDISVKITLLNMLHEKIRTRLGRKLYKIILKNVAVGDNPTMEWLRLESGFASTANTAAVTLRKGASALSSGVFSMGKGLFSSKQAVPADAAPADAAQPINSDKPLYSSERIAETLNGIYESSTVSSMSNSNTTIDSSKPVGKVYSDFVRGVFLDSRPLQMVLKLDSVLLNMTNSVLTDYDITDTDTKGWTVLKLTTSIDADKFVSNILREYAQLED